MQSENTFTQFQLESDRDRPEFFHVMKYPSNGYYAHVHRNSELYCVFSGEVKVSVNDKTYVLHAGEAVFINSLDLHSYQCEQSAEIGLVLIGYRYMRDFRALFPNHIVPTLLKDKEANAEIFALVTQLGERESFSDFEKFSYTNLLLHLITKAYGVEVKENTHKFLLIDIIQYIYDNFMLPLSLETVAKYFNYNPVYLSHLFAKHIRIDFRTFVSNVRMQYVLAMRNDPRYKGKSLSEIALLCGFNSLSTFQRAYKRSMQKQGEDLGGSRM